jgi:hypothetical protein
MLITQDWEDDRQFFFWSLASPKLVAEYEILIWLNKSHQLFYLSMFYAIKMIIDGEAPELSLSLGSPLRERTISMAIRHKPTYTEPLDMGEPHKRRVGRADHQDGVHAGKRKRYFKRRSRAAILGFLAKLYRHIWVH